MANVHYLPANWVASSGWLNPPFFGNHCSMPRGYVAAGNLPTTKRHTSARLPWRLRTYFRQLKEPKMGKWFKTSGNGQTSGCFDFGMMSMDKARISTGNPCFSPLFPSSKSLTCGMNDVSVYCLNPIRNSHTWVCIPVRKWVINMYGCV